MSNSSEDGSRYEASLNPPPRVFSKSVEPIRRWFADRTNFISSLNPVLMRVRSIEYGKQSKYTSKYRTNPVSNVLLLYFCNVNLPWPSSLRSRYWEGDRLRR